MRAHRIKLLEKFHYFFPYQHTLYFISHLVVPFHHESSAGQLYSSQELKKKNLQSYKYSQQILKPKSIAINMSSQTAYPSFNESAHILMNAGYCIGLAACRGDQCRNCVGRRPQREALDEFEFIFNMYPCLDPSEMMHELRILARKLLCHQHQDQNVNIAQAWANELQMQWTARGFVGPGPRNAGRFYWDI